MEKVKEQLEKLKHKLHQLRKSDKNPLSDQPATDGTTSDVDQERASILEQGKSYIRPMSLNPQKALRITGIIIASLIVGVLILFSVLIYRFQSDSDLIYGASRIIPFPAARVDGTFVSYHDYLFELRSLKSYSSEPIDGGQGIDFTTEEGQQQLEVLKSLAMAEAQRKAVVRTLASERDISVSKEEVNETVAQYIEQEGGEEQLEQAIERFYGWSLNDFREVIRIQLTQQRLAEIEAQAILERVEEGEDFAELAEQYSSDGSASEGGDLGFITEDTPFVEEFLEAALALEPGEHTGLVETQFGYHIIMATERDDEEGLRVSHILIDPSIIQNQIQERLENAEISNYIGVPREPEQPEVEDTPGTEEEGAEATEG